jgi:hypothetical protein
MAASVVSREWLEWVAQLSRAQGRRGQRGDPDRFSCWVEEQPGLLVPARWLRPWDRTQFEKSSQELKLEWNPRCFLCALGETPTVLNHIEEWQDGFSLGRHWTAWVQAAEAGQCRPFWLEDDLARRLLLAQSNSRTGILSTQECQSLRRARILIVPLDESKEHAAWEARIAQNRLRFQKYGYTAVDGLLHPFHVGELRRYFRRMIRRGRINLGDFQSSRRYVAHNEPVTRFFHLQLTETVAQLVGEPVRSSYVYFASYQGGAKLKRHTDREQCEFSVTFCLDYAPEPPGATPWPLRLETERGHVTVHQALGDALLYKGRELPHSRERLPDGHTSTSIFFHYVRADFKGSLS